MGIVRKSGGANVAPTTVKRRSGGTWADVQTIKRRSSGAWVTVWTNTGPLSASVDPSSISRFGTGSASSGPSGSTGIVTASGSGGSGNYTFSWARISGDSSTAISSTTAATVTFNRASCNNGINYNSVWRCTVSDGTSSAYADVNVTLGYVSST